VTVIMGIVVGLTFLFGFGNVLNLALRLGVPIWVAPLIAPAVDLSILGLLLGTRHLALHGATPEQLRPARRLLVFASTATLALNIANPLVTGTYGKAAFDAVGPLLLIGWAEVPRSSPMMICSIVPAVRTPSIGSSIVARSRQTPSAENFTSAPPARGFWWRSSEPNNPQARMQKPWSLNRNWRDDRLGDDLAFDLVPS
jgi:hypothetical protein